MSDEIGRLVAQLTSLPRENEWVEWKENKADPQEIGEIISSLSNSAALLGQPRAYILWGFREETRELVGTKFRPHESTVGAEELESWLSHGLSPRLDFRIHEVDADGKPVVIFEIPSATHTPVRFGETEYLRVGSYRKKLRDYPEKERRLWEILTRAPFESGIARPDVPPEELLRLIDFPAYFELTGQPLPTNQAGILDRLVADRLALPADGGRYDVTNLGAILFAKNLENLGLGRKGVRVVVYQGTNRVQTLREQAGNRGYAAGFRGLIEFINAQLPQNEQVRQALRVELKMYPDVAIRELVANALIHQDFSVAGTGPMIEIFEDRIEIANPGVPLIETDRFIDAPPRSRNDALASLARRLKICEERGSGIDKVVFAVEVAQLPAPEFRAMETHTRATLFAQRPFSRMSRVDRIRACYQHASLLQVSGREMTNATLRKRLSIKDENYATASRVISDTLKAGLIKPLDPTSRSKKHAKYLPFWA